jgi:hypothetical protein
MGRICDKCVQNMVENLHRRDHLGKPGTDGRIMDHQEIGCKCMDWIYLTQDSVQWQSLVNMIMYLQSTIKGREIYWPTK